jgi:intracellular septation protein
LISGALVLVFGSITLALRNPLFIQWKVTVVNWLFAAAFLGSQLFSEKTFTQRMMGHAIELEPALWRQLNILWVVNFAVIGALNLYVMYNFDEQTWVYFKTWGMIGLSLLMAVGQAIWISSRGTDPADRGSGS